MVNQCLLLGAVMSRIDKESVFKKTVQAEKRRSKKRERKRIQSTIRPRLQVTQCSKEKGLSKREKSVTQEPGSENFVCLQGIRQPEE